MITFNCTAAKLFQEVYNNSRPQGMGLMHFDPQPLSDADASAMIERIRGNSNSVDMDYIKGRACKFSFNIVDENTQEAYIDQNYWYDHSLTDIKNLIAARGEAQNA